MSPFAIAYGKAYIGLGEFAKDSRHEWCCRKDGGGTLAQAKFAFNNMVNRLTGKSPFAIVYGQVSRHTLDLAFLPKLPSMSIVVEKMADWINAVHIDTNKQLEGSNAKYEGDADKHRRLKTFQGGRFGDGVFEKRMLSCTYIQQIEEQEVWPLSNTQETNDNTYVVELPGDIALSPTFNVADLSEYHALEEPVYLENNSTMGSS